MNHFLKFDELCLLMQAMGDIVSMEEQFVLLLGSLTEDYDQIIKIMENI